MLWYSAGMRVMGVDPGIATTGVGIIDKTGNRWQLCHYGAIITQAHTALPIRLGLLYTDLCGLIRTHSPDSMAIEELFFNTNAKTALVVGQARGVMLLAAHLHHLPVFSYTPVQVKIGVTGYGRADKLQVQTMVKQLLGLDTIPKPDDAADALAIAICHGHSVRLKSLA